MVEETEMLHDAMNSSISSIFVDRPYDSPDSCGDHSWRDVGCVMRRNDHSVDSSVVAATSQRIVRNDVIAQLCPLCW